MTDSQKGVASMSEALIDEPDRNVLLKRLRVADRKIQMMIPITVEAKVQALEIEEARQALRALLVDPPQEGLSLTDLINMLPSNCTDARSKDFSRLKEENEMLRENMHRAIEVQEREKKELEDRVEAERLNLIKIENVLSEKNHHIEFLEQQLSMLKIELREAQAEIQTLLARRKNRSHTSVSATHIYIAAQTVPPAPPSHHQEISRLNATLRAKDTIIEKLNRRLSNVESNAALESTVQQLANREAGFERESARLRNEIESLKKRLSEREAVRLEEKSKVEERSPSQEMSVSASVCSAEENPKTLRFLQSTVVELLLNQRRGKVAVANALLPILCSACGANREQCHEILQGQMPLPRSR